MFAESRRTGRVDVPSHAGGMQFRVMGADDRHIRPVRLRSLPGEVSPAEDEGAID